MQGTDGAGKKMETESKKVRSQGQRIETVEPVSGASRKLAGSVSAKSNLTNDTRPGMHRGCYRDC